MTDVILKEAIVLAGGLGTRLRSAVPDLAEMHGTRRGDDHLSGM